MVALLVKLKIKLLFGAKKLSISKIILAVISVAVELFFIVLFFIFGLSISNENPKIIGAMTVCAGVLFMLIVPLLGILFGQSDTLAPAKFALLPITSKRLQPGMFVAGLFSQYGLIVLTLVALFSAFWYKNIWLLFLGVVSALLGATIVILATRIIMIALSKALRSRKFKDLSALIIGLFCAGGYFLSNFISKLYDLQAIKDNPKIMLASEVISWTPLGWPWALPWDTANGYSALCAIHLGLAVGLIILLWKIWGYYLDRALTSPLEIGTNTGKIKDKSPLDRIFPDNLVGAIASKSLRYWRRDPRLLIQLVFVIVIPITVSVGGYFAGNHNNSLSDDSTFSVGIGVAISFISMFGIFFSNLIMGELSYDGTTIWQYICAGVKGKYDRMGRLLGLLPIWIFMFGLLIVSIFFLKIENRAVILIALFISTSFVFAGVGSWAGTIWLQAIPAGSKSTYVRSNAGLGVTLGYLAEVIICLVLCLPLAGLFGFGIFSWIGVIVSAIISPCYGVFILWGGIILGGKKLDAHWPEVLEKVTVK